RRSSSSIDALAVGIDIVEGVRGDAVGVRAARDRIGERIATDDRVGAVAAVEQVLAASARDLVAACKPGQEVPLPVPRQDIAAEASDCRLDVRLDPVVLA